MKGVEAAYLRPEPGLSRLARYDIQANLSDSKSTLTYRGSAAGFFSFTIGPKASRTYSTQFWAWS